MIPDSRPTVKLFAGRYTRQAPYMVKNLAGGAVTWEVPWRDGTRTRTARRSELLRVLAPLQLLPEVDLMEAVVGVRHETATDQQGGRQVMAWDLKAAAYFAPRGSADVVFPFHKAHARVAFKDSDLVLSFDTVDIGPEMEPHFVPIYFPYSSRMPKQEPKPVRSEYILRSPARLVVIGSLWIEEINDLPSQGADVTARLGVVGTQQDAIISWDLERLSSEDTPYIRRWGFAPLERAYSASVTTQP